MVEADDMVFECQLPAGAWLIAFVPTVLPLLMLLPAFNRHADRWARLRSQAEPSGQQHTGLAD